MKKTNGPGKKTTKKTTKSKGTVQVPAGKGASRVVKKSSASGQRIAKASKALAIRKKGGRLLQSEKMAIRKSFNTTKVRKTAPKTKTKKY